MRGANVLAAYDGADGRRLWQTPILGSIGIADQDLFVIEGVVWPGATAVNDQQEPERRATTSWLSATTCGPARSANGSSRRTCSARNTIIAATATRPRTGS